MHNKEKYSSRLFQFSGRGEVYSYTTVYDAPGGYEINTPYHIALITLDEGPRITAQLTDLHFIEKEVEIESEIRTIREYPQLEIGMPVEMVTRRLKQDGDERGMIVYGYKFRPAGLR